MSAKPAAKAKAKPARGEAAPDRATVQSPDAPLTTEQEATLERLGSEVRGKPLKAKVAWVKQHVGAVEKTGQVSFGNTTFSHMQEHGLISVLRPLCRIAAIDYIGGLMAAGAWRVEGNQVILDFALTVFDCESDEELVRWYPNTGVDNADKGFNKAYTGAMKYALQKFFSIPTQAIDDNETVDLDRIGGTTVAAEVRDITSARVSDTEMAALRATLAENVDRLGGNPAIKNILTANFGVSSIDGLVDNKQAFRAFSERIVAQLDQARGEGS